MDVKAAIRARRSVRQFDPQYDMPQAELDELLRLAMLSPTAFNIQHWRFVTVREPELRRQIRAVAWDQAQVTDASVLIVLCADLKAWEKGPERYWQDAPENVREYIVPAIDKYYRGRDQVQRDEVMRSCGIAAQTVMLAAKGLGYDSSPMDGFDFDAVARLINLPQDHVIAMFIAVGKGLRDPWPRAGQLPIEAVTIADRF